MQNRSYGLSRMHLERTRVNKPPVNVPYSSGWHHVWCRSIGETQDSKEEKAAVSAEENKALVRRFFEEVYNRGNLDVADEVLAPDFAWKLPGKDAPIEDYKQWIASQLAASSDLHFSIEEQVAEGEKVVTRLIGSGTHDQKGFGEFAPSGVRITIEAIIIHRVIEGKIVEERNKADFSPGEVLAQVNEAVLARIPANMFVTCFYGVLDPSSGRLVYANAGHNLPCCCHNEHAATELSARGMPLGLMQGMRYEENEAILVPGESVLFYTDGLIEAHNSQGEMFGTPRLRSLLSERFERGRGLSATLLEELERFTGEGGEQEDDITLLTLECSAARN